MAHSPGLDFDNLPLVEAAVRATFSDQTPLGYTLINSIAASLEPTFPHLDTPKQLETVPGREGTEITFGPSVLPGARYVAQDNSLSVSVQPQVIVARWSRQPGFSKSEYPRYQKLRESLWTAVEAFRKACGDDNPGIAVVNMSYVNFIPVSDPATVLKRYFSDAAQLNAMGGARQVRKLEASWTEDDVLDVRFAIEQVTARLGDSVEQGYRLVTACGIRLGESQNAKSGLDQVHDKLQVFFSELISDHAKKEWKLREHNHG